MKAHFGVDTRLCYPQTSVFNLKFVLSMRGICPFGPFKSVHYMHEKIDVRLHVGTNQAGKQIIKSRICQTVANLA